jgi:pimeloyl-ACP methyl ester carboxylesterase
MSRESVVEGWIELPAGTRIYHRRAGSGEPIVLLHGIAHSSNAWDHVAGELAEHHQVIALDLPGCGRSDKPDTDYSLGAQAAAVRYALDALDLDLVTVIGHSLGGGIAMMLAYLYPERVGRLGLVATAGLGRHLHPLFRIATLPVAPQRVMRVLFHPAVRLPRNAIGGLLSPASADPFFFRPAAHRKEFEELLVGLEDPAAQRAFLATLRSACNVAGQAISALDRIAAARFPVLIVWGREDRVFPLGHALQTAELLPDARLVIIDECGHFPQLEATEAFTSALLDWLGVTRPLRTYTPARPASAEPAA